MIHVRARAPLAIVGMGCVLPHAHSVAAFGQRLRDGTPLFHDVPAGRWLEAHTDSLLAGDDVLPHMRGAFIDGFSLDARRFRLAPRVVERLNPMCRVLLHAAAASVDDATASGTALPAERTGFALGCEGLGLPGDHSLRVRQGAVLDAIDAEDRAAVAQVLGEALTPITEDGVLGAVSSLAMGRVMNTLDLRGPHVAIDAGGASSLAALDAAWDWLDAGSCDAALVGGASAWSSPADWLLWSKARRLTATVPRPFDADADGTLLGEGAVVMVVQRLSDAVSGDRPIYGVIQGLGSAFGGRHGRLAPPARETYLRAFRAAHDEASTGRVDYVECQASGRPREDATEIDALVEFHRAPLVVGSVKAVIGELRAGAGMAGLLGTCLALANGEYFPAPVGMPHAGLTGGTLTLLSHRAPWLAPPTGARTAGVTACSDVGSVYHLVVQGGEAARIDAQPRTSGARFPRLAVVGLGARLAGVPDAATFWSKTLVGHSAIRGILAAGDLGATLSRVPLDLKSSGLPPRAVRQLDRSWSWAADAAHEAARDSAALRERVPADRVCVAVATAPEREREHEVAGRVALTRVMAAFDQVLRARRFPDDTRRARLRAARARLEFLYPRITEDSLLGCQGSALAAYVARTAGAGGCAIAVESACASSHAAVQVLARMLERGAGDLGVVAGVSDVVMPETLATFRAFGALSPTGAFPLDERADGLVLGEGAVSLVLARAADVRESGVYATLIACEGTSDGRGGSMFAPRTAAQAESCRRAHQQCESVAAGVEYIECHAAGTAVGDVAELATYADVYGGQDREHSLMLGSCKSAVGHLNAGAGAAGLLRAVLALHHRAIPPTAGVARLRPDAPLGTRTFEIPDRARPWPAPRDDRPRRAAVSAFGLGGTSFHALLEEWVVGEADHRGFEAVTGDQSPLIDAHARRRAAGSICRRTLDARRELFLREHLVDGRPVLPGAFGCEIMAQAAALSVPGLRPVGLENVSFERLLEVPAGEPVVMHVDVSAPHAAGAGRVGVDVTVAAEYRPAAYPDRIVQRRHYRGRVLLAAADLPAVHIDDDTRRATRLPRISYRSIYDGHSFCHLGPTFQAIRETVKRDDACLLARIEVPFEDQLLADCVSPRFWLGPLALDNYLQTAGTMGVYRTHCFPMPASIRSITLWDAPAQAAAVWACATVVREAAGALWHRIEAFDEDGRVLCRCEDFVTRTGRPFSSRELEMFYEGLSGGPPEERSIVAPESAGAVWT